MESVNPQIPNLACLPASTRCLLFLVIKGPVGSIPRQIHNYPLTPGQTPQGFDLISWMQGSLASGGLTSEDDELRVLACFHPYWCWCWPDWRLPGGSRVSGGMLCQDRIYRWAACWIEFTTSCVISGTGVSPP